MSENSPAATNVNAGGGQEQLLAAEQTALTMVEQALSPCSPQRTTREQISNLQLTEDALPAGG